MRLGLQEEGVVGERVPVGEDVVEVGLAFAADVGFEGDGGGGERGGDGGGDGGEVGVVVFGVDEEVRGEGGDRGDGEEEVEGRG